MKIFVTGATGYVGGAVAAHLHRHGHTIIGLARSDEAANKLTALGMAVHRGDLNDPASLLEPVADADAIVQAGFDNKRLSGGNRRGERDAVEVMLDALKPGAKFVYTSGFGIYNDGTGPDGFDEAVRAAPPSYLSWRVALEDEVVAVQGRVGIVLRLPMVYGGSGNMVFKGMMAQGTADRRVTYVGAGETRKSLVHLDDMAELYRLAIEKIDASTVLQVGDGRTITDRALAELVARKIGPDVAVESVPLEKALEKAFWAKILAMDMILVPDRAKALLGWTPKARSIEEETLGYA
jgi:nucleoside-diphosphate-sugar epimerase